MAEMKRQLRAHRLIQMRVLGDPTPLQEFLLAYPGVHNIANGEETNLPMGTIRVDFGGDDAALSRLLAAVVAGGIQLVSFHEETGDLEDVFLHVTQGIVN
jgi:ABC-2 type transport system ATP-binding protein